MGQKIHPTGFRLSVQRNWTSKWYSNSKKFATMLNEDIKVREFLRQKLGHAAVGKSLSSGRRKTPELPFSAPVRVL